MTQVRLHYWAGARAAAGVESEIFTAETIADALHSAAASRADQTLARVLAGSTLLRDGRALHENDRRAPLDEDVTIEVLPPFAGG
jgi:molybdopterin synthase sulfur carrier subunit